MPRALAGKPVTAQHRIVTERGPSPTRHPCFVCGLTASSTRTTEWASRWHDPLAVVAPRNLTLRICDRCLHRRQARVLAVNEQTYWVREYVPLPAALKRAARQEARLQRERRREAREAER